MPNLDIVLGRFLTSEVRMPVADHLSDRTTYVRVVKTEEKGSDVNIASHVLRDAFRGKCDAAILVTNDSDLVEPIRIVREELGLVVGLLNPHKRASRVLHRYASFMRPIRNGVLAVSQFPLEVHDQTGVFRKPERW